ncbi:auxin-responsive protein SAUR23-like [Lotus japonicus]|uniref:auxin-responsive protein SAUR23-like n=1 Tax=Lotus japonicus TaxID=34305 RepID=UPI00258F94C4|nr:auxin-responsive protein SAUR23-like [Lotus japonicus]
MAGAMKKVDKIRQIVRLKQVMMRWKQISLRRHDSSDPRPPSGCLYVYVGHERQRFAIPARFLNLPVFAGLLDETEEEFGLRGSGGLILPCDVCFFTHIVKRLHKNENKYGKLTLEQFVITFSDAAANFDSCKDQNVVVFTPLLQKAEV